MNAKTFNKLSVAENLLDDVASLIEKNQKFFREHYKLRQIQSQLSDIYDELEEKER